MLADCFLIILIIWGAHKQAVHNIHDTKRSEEGIQ